MSIELPSSEIRSTRLTHNSIIVATGRGKRPDQFKAGDGPKICPFCPGNEHLTPGPEIHYITGEKGWRVRVVPNKYPTFKIEGMTTGFNHPHTSASSIPDAHGAHEVLIETPSHTADYTDLAIDDLLQILHVCSARITDLYRDPRIRNVQVFKNHGPEAGASLPHPHSQIIGLPQIPHKLRTRLHDTEEYYIENGRSIFTAMLEYADIQKREVYQNRDFICITPYEAKFPFEMCIMPTTPRANFRDSESDFDSLANIMRITFRKLKKLFAYMPPFNTFIEEAPPKNLHNCNEFFCWRYRIMPRLTMIAGFELATALYVNPTSPEECAKMLREIQID